MSNHLFIEGDDGLSRWIRRSESCSYRLFYHFVWSPKYRRAALTLERARVLISILMEICADYGYEFFGVSVEDDHTHLLIGLKPKTAPAEAIRTLKSISARRMFLAFPKLRDEVGPQALWSEGYSVDSVGWTTPARLTEYMRQQEDHHGRPAEVLFRAGDQEERKARSPGQAPGLYRRG